MIIKISNIPVTSALELMLRLPIMTLFIFSIIVFLSKERQSVAVREFSHAPKIDFLGTLLSRLFEDREPTNI